MPLELSAITGTLVKLGAEKAFAGLNRQEAVIKARERLGLPTQPKPGDFEAIYRHALVEWGVFKPKPVLDLFRDRRVISDIHAYYQTGDAAALGERMAWLADWATRWRALGGVETDPRTELSGFLLTFERVVNEARPVDDALHDRRMTAGFDAILARIDQLGQTSARQQVESAGDSPPPLALSPAEPAGAPEIRTELAEIKALLLHSATGDVHFSGQFQNVIINLLSHLENVGQTTTAAVGSATRLYDPPPLPPLDEHGRPPLPEARRDLPPGSRLPYEPNPFFTGREDELRELARALLYPDLSGVGRPDRSERVTRNASFVTITSGIGGIGKTQLAVEFAHRYGRFFAGGVQWVSLADGDADAIGREVAACGAAMGLWPEAQDAALSPEAKVARTQRHWAGPEARLVVFDNCDGGAGQDARALLAAWRPKPGGARVLVTSRSADWPAGFTALAVPALPREQSRALLREYLERADPPRRESDAHLDTVAAELGDLPLALTLAGSYLAEYPGVAVAAYLADLRAPEWLDHPSLRGQGRPQAWTNHDLDVARTFRVSLDRLRPDDSNSDAAAIRLLAGAACLLPGEPFPRQLLTGMLDDTAPHLPDDALRRLLALGLLERAGEGRLRLHRLLAAFATGALVGETEAAREAVERAVMALAARQDVKRDPRPFREWFGHFRYVVDKAFDREDERAANLCGWLDYCLSNSGDLAGALPYSQRALAIRERVLGPNHPATARSLNNLGFLLQAQGDLAGARPYYERALAIRERVLGPDHPDTAQSLNNLGFLLQAQGDLAGARPYLERALAISERVLGPDHPDTAQSLNNLGGLLQDQGDLAGARPYYERALAIREHVLGPDHPDTALSLNNLGVLWAYEGNFPLAADYMRRALAVLEKVLGPNHPNTRQSRDDLAVIAARLR